MRFLVIIIPFLFSACSVDHDPEAGVYQGKIDPHEQSHQERVEALRLRILQIQTDR